MSPVEGGHRESQFRKNEGNNKTAVRTEPGKKLCTPDVSEHPFLLRAIRTRKLWRFEQKTKSEEKK